MAKSKCFTEILSALLWSFIMLLALTRFVSSGEADPSWRRLTQQNKSLPDNVISDIALASDGSIWIGTLTGLRRYTDGAVTLFTSNVKMPVKMVVRCLLEVSDGTMWIGTDQNGVILGRQAQLNFLGFEPDRGAVQRLIEYNNSVLVIYTNSIARFDLQSKQWDRKIYRPAIELSSENSAGVIPNISVTYLSATTGLLWLGTDNGEVHAISASTLDEQVRESSAKDEESSGFGKVTQIFEAKDRTIWVGTQGAGIWRFSGQQREQFTEANSPLQDAAATKFAEDEQGNIWISTHDGGVGRYSSEAHKWEAFGTWNNKLGSNRVTDMVVHGRDVWVSTDKGGISRFVKGEWISFTQESSGLGENSIQALLPLKNGDLAALGQGGTVSFYLASSGWRISRPEASVPLLLYQSSDSTVWLSTFTGLYRETFGDWRQINAPQVSSLKVRQILETKGGTLAFRTLVDGLTLYNPPSAEIRLPLVLDQSRRLIKFHIEAHSSQPSAWTLFYNLSSEGKPSDGPLYNSQQFDGGGDAVVAVPTDKTEKVLLKYYAVGPDGQPAVKPVVNIAKEVEFRISYADRWADLIKRSAPFILPLHIVFWSILFIFYPYSPMIQSLFFWNPHVRKIGGLWYIDVLLSAPVLRSRLLTPFKGSLTSDVDPLPSSNYFQSQTVCEFLDGDIRPPFAISKLADLVSGHVIIRGKSGSGKTHFLRYLIGKRNTLSVFLPAGACGSGVVEAILDYLPAHINDAFLVEKLVYHGAMAVYIDGLNEASVEARQSVVSCFRKFPHSTIVVTTQPLNWHPPNTVRTYDIQPLDRTQIFQYLHFKGQSSASFEQQCNRFLFAHLDDQKLTAAEVERNLDTLSIPFDLDIAASLMKRGLSPTLYSLQQQFFGVIAADYEEKFGDNFPFLKLCNVAYQSKLSGSKQVECGELEDYLLIFLLEKKIIIMGNLSKKLYRFRHDRIQDYLIIKFLEVNPDMQLNHLDDVRFLGVYLLLAAELSEDQARVLMENLSIAAAKTKEHSISDAFVMKLLSRNLIGEERDSKTGRMEKASTAQNLIPSP